jgi:hypothetical protein
MSKSQSLLDERHEIEAEVLSGRHQLARINETLVADRLALETHHQARVEIAARLAVSESRLEAIDQELFELAEARSEGHEQSIEGRT